MNDSTRPTRLADLTEGSLALLLALWNDRWNWSGVPLFGGNVGGDPASLGHLTDLKKKGLLSTDEDYDDPSLVWVYFSDLATSLLEEEEAVR